QPLQYQREHGEAFTVIPPPERGRSASKASRVGVKSSCGAERPPPDCLTRVARCGSRPPPSRGRYDLAIIACSRLSLHQRAVIEAAVEPVLIARDVLLHGDVDERLI